MTSSSSGVVPDPLPPGPAVGGGLADRLRRTAAELGLDLPAPEKEWERSAEFKDADGRWVCINTPNRRRRHDVRFRKQGAWLATGRTADLAAVVRATVAWMSGADLEQTRAVAPFIRFGDWAVAHEREPLDPVELAWWHKLDRYHLPPWDRRPHSRALTEAAHAQPALRRLMPVNSHYMLWFSTRVNFPYASVGYSVDPHHDGLYVVRNEKGEVVARTETPEEAVALVVAALPEDAGPAR
ncbi:MULTISPECIES: DUF6193 family natural product biosynthesis protein [unclassified Kitasatospora]|uniref:DUF6193 family natural product biosynthesis protein n=1 Tax=unclassified Kitasatospora TaxID=2633591 RepID=UPI0038161C48